VCDCLLELLAKGMDPAQKILLLEVLGLEPVLARHFVPRVNTEAEVEFQFRLARVVDRFGHEALCCLREIKTAITVPAGTRKEELEAKADAKVDSALQLLFGFLNSSHLEVSAATMDFTSMYLGQLKQSGAVSEKTTAQLKALLTVLAIKMRQLEGVKASAENEEDINQYHNQVATLFKTIARLTPELCGARRSLSACLPAHQSHQVVHMSELLTTVLSNVATAQAADLKASLTLFFWMSEGLSEEAIRTKLCESFFSSILVAILRSNVLAHPVRCAFALSRSLSRSLSFRSLPSRSLPLSS
jgi:hypothetical protein